jgi:glycosyltransferase involved in cell wall biosynthesis
MKVLFASSSSGSRGGGETFLVYLGEALARRGHEVALWTAAHARMDDVAGRFGKFGAVHRVSYTNTYDRRGRSLGALVDGGTARRAAREWDGLKPDIVHINKQNLEDGMDLLRAAGMVQCPTVCTVHITQSARFLKAKGAWLRDWVARRGLRGYGGTLVAVSDGRVADLRAFAGNTARVRAIPNGVPISPPLPAGERKRIREVVGIGVGELGVIAVGRMTEQKRPLLFVEMAGRIVQRVPEARFFWIGDGPLAGQWDAAVAAKGIGAKVKRLGWREDVTALMGSADLLLHTAEYEGMPLAILEAMAAGLPCAVCDTVAREMPFLDASNSLRGSDEEAVGAILRDREELARRGTAAAEMARERFSTDVMAEAYEALYRERVKAR